MRVGQKYRHVTTRIIFHLTYPVMHQVLRYFFALIIFTACAFSTQAQDCGCDHVITPPENRATSLVINGDIMGVKPGETICLAAGFYMQIRFTRMNGEPGNPIKIQNCGGMVEIGDAITFGRWYAVDIAYSNYVRLTGTGNAGLKYGIKVGKSGDSALKVGASSDTEIDHLDIGNANFAGILAKTDYRGNVPPDAPEMNNLNIHDNYIHDTRGEGLYIGETTTPGQNFRHLEIWNNIITRAGLDLAQIANAVEDAQIHHNVMYRGGLRLVNYQNKGLQIGDNSVGQFYNNIIMHVPSNSMIVMASGNVDIYNNYMQGANDPGMFIDNRSVSFPGTAINIRDNYLMDVRTTVPFFNIFNEVNAVNITGNSVEGSNTVVGLGPGVGALVTESSTMRRTIERLTFIDVATDNFTLSEGSMYVGLGLLENVTGRNNRPFIQIIPTQKLDAETTLTVAVKAFDEDADALTLEAFNLPPFVTFQDHGDGTGSFSIIPQMNDIGIYHKVRVRVTDSKGGMNTQYYSLHVLDPYAFIASANSSKPGSAPENTLDNNLTTRWEGAEAGGNWIKYNLREDKHVTAVQVSFHNGTSTVYPFEIEVSLDDKNWTKVFSGTNSGTTAELENFGFPQVKARHLRISDAGSAANSYNEVVINAITAPVLHTFTAAADVYTDARRTYDHATVKTKEWKFVSHLRFIVADLNVVKSPVISTRLRMRADASATGTLHIYLGDNTQWNEKSSPWELPSPAKSLAKVTGNFVAGEYYELDLGREIKDNGSYNLVLMAENTKGTLSFSASESSADPGLLIETLRGAIVENSVTSVAVETIIETQTAESPWLEQVQIYPNPVDDELTIELKEEIQGLVSIEIFDKSGKPVLQRSWRDPEESLVIDLEDAHMEPGMYMVNVKQEGFAAKTLRMFKK